jgi:hypothetical protein
MPQSIGILFVVVLTMMNHYDYLQETVYVKLQVFN